MKTNKLYVLAVVLALSALAIGVSGIANAQGVFNKYGPANGVQCSTGSTYVNTACTASQIPPAGSTTQIQYNLGGVLTGNAQATVASDLGVLLGSPTGGSKGPGTLNATALYINGAAVGTSSGAVSSVALADASSTPIFTITGSPVTAAGTLTETLMSQAAHAVLIGPTSSTAQPTFRALVGADIPALGANPSASFGVNLTGANGSAITYLRSDAVLTLDQSIAPTWTGHHIFTPSSGVAITANVSGGNTAGVFVNNSSAGGVEYTLCGTSNTSGARCWDVRVGSTGTYTLTTATDAGVEQNDAFGLTRDTSGNFTGAIIPQPASGVALSITGSTGAGVLTLNGGNATNSYTRYQTAGTGLGFIGDAFSVFGSNSGDFGIGGGGTAIHIGPGAESLNIGTAGNVTIAAPASGIAETVNGLTGTQTLQLNSTGGASGSLSFGWNVGIGAPWNLYTSADSLIIGANGASSTLTLSTNGTGRETINSTGNVTVSAPASSTAFAVSGLTATNTIQASSTGAASVLGFGWAAGINASSWNLWTQSTDTMTVGTQGNESLFLATDAVNRLTISGAGLVTFADGTHGAAYQFTSTMTSGTTNSVACYGGCGSPSASRTTTGTYVYTHNIGVSSLEWTCSIQNSAGNAPGVYPVIATGASTSNAVTLNFYNSTGSLTDPATGTQAVCTALAPF